MIADYLYLLQSIFWPGFKTGIILTTMVVECWEINSGIASLLVLLGLSVAFVPTAIVSICAALTMGFRGTIPVVPVPQKVLLKS